MTEEVTKYEVQGATLEKVLIGGDLSALTPSERVNYYQATCRSLGLNPLTKPFDYIKLNNRLVLYAKRDCTDQLRKIHKVSITDLGHGLVDDIYSVIAHAKDGEGRTDIASGAVSTIGLKGEMLAHALMKAETKAKRRVTLSIVGLGWLDETEIETIPDAQPIAVTEDGEIVETPKIEPSYPRKTNGKHKKDREPIEPLRLKDLMVKKVALHEARHAESPATEAQIGLLAGKLEEIWKPDVGAARYRHAVTKFLVGEESTRKLSNAEASSMLDWLLDEQDAEGNYPINAAARVEAQAIIRLLQKEAGQQEFPA